MIGMTRNCGKVMPVESPLLDVQMTPIAKALLNIWPTIVDGAVYYPCAVTTKQGDYHQAVHIVSEKTFRAWWGIPGKSAGCHLLDASEIDKLELSPASLPPQIANEVAGYGETGMGYVLFWLKMRDGTFHLAVSGNVPNFLAFPAEYDPSDIIGSRRFERHESSKPTIQPMDYLWCLVSEEDLPAI